MPALPVAVTGLEEKWLTIEQVDNSHRRAWAEGELVASDKLVIDTSNVARFRLDLSRIKLDWNRRIVLRIDGFNRELTRKRWPILVYERTPTGAWEPMEDPPEASTGPAGADLNSSATTQPATAPVYP